MDHTSPVLRRAAGIDSRLRFAAYALAARLRPGPIRSILFPNSRPDWNPALERGCRVAGYQSTFAPLDPDTISDHDLVVPFTASDVLRLDGYRESIVGNPLPVPSRQAVLLCDDKREFAQRLIDEGFGQHVPPIHPTPSFPYILKRAVDEGSNHCHLVSDVEDRQALSALAEDGRYFAQAFVKGHREYATHMVVRDRRAICALELEYTFATETPIKLQDPVLYKRVRKSPHIALFTSILNTIGFEGLCCVNYKSIDGHPWILEINPRMGGSLGTFLFSFVRYL